MSHRHHNEAGICTEDAQLHPEATDLEAGIYFTPLRDYLEDCEATITFLSGPASGLCIPLDQPVTVLGSGPGADVAINDDTLARRHLAIRFLGGAFRLQHIDPGTLPRVNGRVVESARLFSGDCIEFGHQRMVVEMHPKPSPFD